MNTFLVFFYVQGADDGFCDDGYASLRARYGRRELQSYTQHEYPPHAGEFLDRTQFRASDDRWDNVRVAWAFGVAYVERAGGNRLEHSTRASNLRRQTFRHGDPYTLKHARRKIGMHAMVNCGLGAKF